MINRLTTLLTLLALLSGCVTSNVNSGSVPALKTYGGALDTEEILDIGVVVFDPGIDDTVAEEGVYPEIRRAEATFQALQLATELDDQGVWGATRVIPSSSFGSDVIASGKILQSDGQSLKLQVTAEDSTGVIWIDREYKDTTNSLFYKHKQRTKTDPFQKIYRDIANDLLRFFRSMTTADRIEVRNVSKMQFAIGFAPDAYSDYIKTSDSGVTELVRLPAESDPMLKRINTLATRNEIFIDTLQGHYENFSNEMIMPYDEWRRLSLEEAKSLEKLQIESRRQLITGGAALIAGIAAATSDDRDVRTAGAVGMYAGGSLIKSGLERRAEANIHSLALEELGQSLEAEITPQVIELEDRTIQLSGTIEDQYGQWREILSDIYAAEIAELPTNISQPSP